MQKEPLENKTYFSVSSRFHVHLQQTGSQATPIVFSSLLAVVLVAREKSHLLQSCISQTTHWWTFKNLEQSDFWSAWFPKSSSAFSILCRRVMKVSLQAFVFYPIYFNHVMQWSAKNIEWRWIFLSLESLEENQELEEMARPFGQLL